MLRNPNRAPFIYAKWEITITLCIKSTRPVICAVEFQMTLVSSWKDSHGFFLSSSKLEFFFGILVHIFHSYFFLEFMKKVVFLIHFKWQHTWNCCILMKLLVSCIWNEKTLFEWKDQVQGAKIQRRAKKFHSISFTIISYTIDIERTYLPGYLDTHWSSTMGVHHAFTQFLLS